MVRRPPRRMAAAPERRTVVLVGGDEHLPVGGDHGGGAFGGDEGHAPGQAGDAVDIGLSDALLRAVWENGPELRPGAGSRGVGLDSLQQPIDRLVGRGSGRVDRRLVGAQGGVDLARPTERLLPPWRRPAGAHPRSRGSPPRPPRRRGAGGLSDGRADQAAAPCHEPPAVRRPPSWPRLAAPARGGRRTTCGLTHLPALSRAQHPADC